MKQETFQKIIGIIIVTALIGSMLAAGLLYAPQESNQTTNTNNTTQTKSYTYDISFQTQVLDELNSIKIACETTSLSKENIDLEINSLKSVLRIKYSQFIKNSETWYYLAEIDLKKNSNIDESLNEIFDLNYFDGSKEAMKKVSIKTPKEKIELYNADLNITRNFEFDFSKTVALVSTNTFLEDEITVSGKIELQKNTILNINLTETNNITNQPEYFSVEKEFPLNSIENKIFFEVKYDSNIDKNYFEEQLNLLDINSSVFVYEKTLIGQANANKENLTNLFSDANELNLTKQGTIFIDSLFVPDLNKTFDFNKEKLIEIDVDKKTNDLVNAKITISVQRNNIDIYQVNSKK